MSTLRSDVETLKGILENFHTPEKLDSHPWACRSFVKDAVERDPRLGRESPGWQLVAALSDVFPGTMPSTPPRRGKRLDTHWGAFGMLASLYFAPFAFGAQVPNTLRDAWGRIDPSIQLYVFGSDQHSPAEQLEAYRLVAGEPEIAAASTLSDWRCKGIERLADAVAAREKYLRGSQAGTGPLERRPDETAVATERSRPPANRRLFFLTLIVLLGVLLVLGGQKAYRIYGAAVVLRGDLSQLQELRNSSPNLQTAMEAGPLLSKAKSDFKLLSNEAAPLLWLGPKLGWIPIYGEDLKSSPALVQMADDLFESAELSYQGFRPLAAALSSGSSPDPAQLIGLLNEAQPELVAARQSFARAMQSRAGLNVDQLSPRTRSIVEERLDPILALLGDGLTAATSLPRLLGAASDGPKTYLLLAQNEDELRPTGGFITAVGTMVVQNGKVVRVKFVDSGEVENWDFPYPQAPWQLEEYMNSPVLILRDANWFPDFPTTTLYVESLYAYSYSHSVDGVIAFDQHMLVTLLEALGPIQVEGATDPIDAQNVVSFMRISKSLPADGIAPPDWSRKGFMDKIAQALLERVFEGKDTSWENVGTAFFKGLNEGHLLLQLDDPDLTAVLAHYGWDGAIRYAGGDFLMVVDSNIGFNKTNAVVDTALAYDVDLNDVIHPIGTLTVNHQNRASADVACVQWGSARPLGEEAYPIDACYWNYMRVYVPSGTTLLEGTPQIVPAEWMILDTAVNAPVDELDEQMNGLQGFGALMVVPGGHAKQNSFRFQLPASILFSEGKQRVYRLDIEKQPGTLATPITIRIHLPRQAVLTSSSMKAITTGHDLLIETDLRTDLHLKVVFSLP